MWKQESYIFVIFLSIGGEAKKGSLAFVGSKCERKKATIADN